MIKGLSRFELRLLGTVDLWADDGLAAARVLAQPKRLALLVYLTAATPRGFHRRDTLVALFWPELDQEHARAALRNALHFLRRQLGENVICARGDEVAVERARMQCDVLEFEDALASGAREPALALYRGDFLKGFHVSGAPGFDHWQDAERDRLRRRASEAAWHLVGANGKSDDVASIHWMRVAQQILPDDEVGFQRLLRSLDANGDRAGALREYELFSRRMAAEFDTVPSPPTLALVESIRARVDTVPRDEGARSGNSGPASVVVLPFASAGQSKGNDHYASGIANEISMDLATLAGIRVISRATAARLREGVANARAIGEALDVAFVVDGEVNVSGDELTITARVTAANSGLSLWSRSYDGSKEEIFDLQERVARDIAGSIRREPGSTPASATRARHHGSVHVYDCYHRALQELSRYTEDGLSRAVEHVRNGLALVGENDLLLATMAYVYIQFVELGIKPDGRYLEKAEACAHRALSINPRSCLALVARGLIAYKRGETEQTVQCLKHALEIDPDQRDALFWLSLVYLIAGREAAAHMLLSHLLDIDPLTPVNHCLPGYAELLQGNPEGALPAYRRMHQMDAGNPVTRWFLAQVIARCGRRGEALALLRQIIRDTPETIFSRHAQFLAHALERNRDAALAAATSRLLNESRWDQHASWWMAATYALVGETDAAIEWLANASALGFINYPFLSRHDPFLENLRGDPAFWRLMAQVKSRWERFVQ